MTTVLHAHDRCSGALPAGNSVCASSPTSSVTITFADTDTDTDVTDNAMNGPGPRTTNPQLPFKQLPRSPAHPPATYLPK